MSAAWFIPQSRDRDLAQHAHRLELRGVPTDFVWPDVCPACGTPARDRLEVQKVFVRPAAGTMEQEKRGRWRVGVAVGLAIAGLVTWRVLAA